VNDVHPPVLLAVADEALGHSLQFLLEVEGCLVRCCRSARDLVDEPSLLACRCLILDHHPPDWDGLALLPFLQGCCPRLAVILLVGRIDAPLAAQVAGFRLGAIIEKPLLDNLLLDAVRQELGQGWRHPDHPYRSSGVFQRPGPAR
jgi:FixJ family two-component response regulator